MRTFLLFFLFVPLLRATDLATLEDLTAQWVNLRSEQAREREAWNDELSRIRLELSLLESSEKRIQEELNTLRSGEDEAETQQSEILRELDTCRRAIAQLPPELDALHARLLAQARLLPEPLRRRLDAELQAAESAPAEALQRLRVTLALQHQLLSLQNDIHHGPMIIDLAGERREMDVLWIGTLRAYAVSAVGEHAALGTPKDGVWTWQSQPDLAERIRLALRITRGETAPVLVPLPLEVAP
jgi:hypothetical protein